MSEQNAELISIIIPVYNAAKQLKDCIDSVLKQTFQQLEIILVDDGSTDGSAEICDKMGQQHSRIKVIHCKNEGVSAARNLGIELSVGQYISFVDADDSLEPDMLRTLMEYMKPEIAVVGCSFYEEKESYVHYTKTSDYLKKGIIQGDTRCWSKIYRRTFIGNTRFRTGITIGEDMLFLVDLFLKEGRVVVLSYKGYCYTENTQGAMYSAFKSSYMDQIRCWKIAYELLKSDDMEQNRMLMKQILIGCILVLDKLSLLSSDKWKEQKCYLETCSDCIKQYRYGIRELSRNHKLKIRFFKINPYLLLVIEKRLHNTKIGRKRC